VSRLPGSRGDFASIGDRQDMTTEESLHDAEQKMRSAVSFTQEELSSLRTGRANPKLLDRVTVDYYGTQVPLNQLASFSVPEPRLLVIQPFDRNVVAAMEKAIMSSDLGLTPSNDGNVIRLAFPSLTEERRKDLTKMARDRAEEGRVSVRNVRRHAKEQLERLEHDHTISEDDLRRAEKELQRLTDQYVAEIDRVLENKEKELMEV
jgi:ribosome recycling factor